MVMILYRERWYSSYPATLVEGETFVAIAEIDRLTNLEALKSAIEASDISGYPPIECKIDLLSDWKGWNSPQDFLDVWDKVDRRWLSRHEDWSDHILEELTAPRPLQS